jgi:hypothetical protein
VQKNEQYRSATNIPSDQTAPEHGYSDYVLLYDEDDATSGKIPDLLLDVPVLKVDEIDLAVDSLRAQVNVSAEVLQLANVNVGVDARLGNLKLVIQGVEAQALLKARFNDVTAILDRIMTTIDRNPQILEKLAEGGSCSGRSSSWPALPCSRPSAGSCSSSVRS